MSKMGQTYAWASPDYILHRMTLPMLREFAGKIPQREKDIQAQLAQITAMLANMGRKDDKDRLEPHDVLTGYARAARVPTYKRHVALALSEASRRRLLPQAVIDLVDWTELRKDLQHS